METTATETTATPITRNVRTHLYALIYGPEGKITVLKSDSYKDLKAQIKNLGDVKIQTVIRGREIPVRAETNVKFF